MNAFEPGRRRLTGLAVATTLAFALLAPGAAGAAAPAQLSPKPGALLERGSRPVFKVRDTSRAARRYSVYITISTSKARRRNGDLRKTSVGHFASMRRRGSTFSYMAENYTFPTWFMVRPGTYYWQVYRIDCSARRSCHVHSKVRSFRVQ